MARNRITASKRGVAPLSTGGSASVGYEAVAASQTAQVLGSTGATGDILDRILIIPATTSPGLVSVLDGVTTIFTYAGGSAPTVVPFEIAFGITSRTGPWKITTGVNVAVLAFGNFT